MAFEACPISFHQVDGTLARIISFYIALFVVLFLLTLQSLILYFLILDFLTRLYGSQKYSVVANIAKGTKYLLGLKKETVDGSAKRLAAYFGLLFMVLLAIEAFIGLKLTSYITAAIFLLCASMEIVFDFCIGCKIYFIIRKFVPTFMDR